MGKQSHAIPSVLVSIIHRPGERIEAELVGWLLRQQARSLTGQATFALGDILKGKPFDAQRNRQVASFLATRYERLMFVDADIVPPGDAIDRLLDHDKAICGIASQSFQFDEPFAVILEADPDVPHGYRQAQDLRGLKRLRNGAIGLACCMIKREVFEKVKPPWFEEILIEGGLKTRDADFVFCEKARAAGYDVWVDCDRLTDHLVVVGLKRINELAVKRNG